MTTEEILHSNLTDEQYAAVIDDSKKHIMSGLRRFREIKNFGIQNSVFDIPG